MTFEKTISIGKFYSVLENLILNNKDEDLYLISAGNFKGDDYKDVAFSTQSTLILNKSIFSKALSVLSRFTASNLGVFKLSRTRESLYESFLFCHYGTITFLSLPKMQSENEFIKALEKSNGLDDLDFVIEDLKSKFKIIEFNAEDEDNIIYMTNSEDMQDLVSSSISKTIVEKVDELEFNEELKYSEVEMLKIIFSFILNNNLFVAEKSDLFDCSEYIYDLFMSEPSQHDYLEYIRLKLISYDLKVYEEITKSINYHKYHFRIFPELLDGVYWAYSYIGDQKEIRELTDVEILELQELKKSIYPLREKTYDSLKEISKDFKKSIIIVVVSVIAFFIGYQMYKSYSYTKNMKRQIELNRPAQEEAIKRLVEKYYPPEKVDSK